MFLTFKKWTALYLLTLLLLFAGFAAILWQGSAVNASKNLILEQGGDLVLVIDPGHGGMDGGAVSADGTAEAQINLAIGLKIEEIARFAGVSTEMTRREDVSIHDPETTTVRAQKASDLKNRTELANSVAGGVLISVHQNSLPQVPSVCGAQVFYSASSGSQELAEAVQSALNQALNPKPKEPKLAGSGVYLLQKAQVPAILVECGFLSNPQETDQLKSSAYQTELAVTIVSAALAHLSGRQ